MLIVLKAVAAKEAVPRERCREEEEGGGLSVLVWCDVWCGVVGWGGVGWDVVLGCVMWCGVRSGGECRSVVLAPGSLHSNGCCGPLQ
jgi:hypothetical protein